MWTLINGGPESAIYKSTDAGATWNKLRAGLPNVELGRIGLAISPVDSNVLYATVEAADRRRNLSFEAIAAVVGNGATSLMRPRCTTRASSPIRKTSIAST